MRRGFGRHVPRRRAASGLSTRLRGCFGQDPRWNQLGIPPTAAGLDRKNVLVATSLHVSETSLTLEPVRLRRELARAGADDRVAVWKVRCGMRREGRGGRDEERSQGPVKRAQGREVVRRRLCGPEGEISGTDEGDLQARAGLPRAAAPTRRSSPRSVHARTGRQLEVMCTVTHVAARSRPARTNSPRRAGG